MPKFLIIMTICVALFPANGWGQAYTAYFTGSASDTTTNPMGGVCMMGGATEDDEAMKWFLQRANGGDVLVLRASGSDGYNDYLYSELGVTVNSVTTIVCHSAAASNDTAVHRLIQNAEAIWFAGGDQWDYVSYWRNTPVDQLINDGISSRNIVIGGTSAGMAIMGGLYFSAENGTVTSATALADPYDGDVTVDSTSFLINAHLSDVVTDTHYDDRERMGRHVVFMARAYTDFGISARGIACDEFTAVCISPDGIARAYGQFPEFDDNVYFIQGNCELADARPENCNPAQALTWDHSGKALNVYVLKGTATGSNTFDLTDWQAGSGGEWEHWYVTDGVLNEGPASSPDCVTTSTAQESRNSDIRLYPNPASDVVTVKGIEATGVSCTLELRDTTGRLVMRRQWKHKDEMPIDLGDLYPGIYQVRISVDRAIVHNGKLIIE